MDFKEFLREERKLELERLQTEAGRFGSLRDRMKSMGRGLGAAASRAGEGLGDVASRAGEKLGQARDWSGEKLGAAKEAHKERKAKKAAAAALPGAPPTFKSQLPFDTSRGAFAGTDVDPETSKVQKPGIARWAAGSLAGSTLRKGGAIRTLATQAALPPEWFSSRLRQQFLRYGVGGRTVGAFDTRRAQKLAAEKKAASKAKEAEDERKADLPQIIKPEDYWKRMG
jgi:hypothetical protein